jgi:hypothetical protein
MITHGYLEITLCLQREKLALRILGALENLRHTLDLETDTQGCTSHR